MFLNKKLFSDKIISILVFLIALSFNQYFGNRGVFPIDSFGFFDSGFRVLNGEYPFKDYWVVSGPFIDLSQAFWFYIFDVNWQSYIFNASFLNGILALLTYQLLIKFNLSQRYSFFYTVSLAILAYPVSGTPFVDQHSTFLSLIAIFLLILAIKTEEKIFWFLIPFALGLAFLSKQVPSTYLGLSIFCLILFNFFHNKKKYFLDTFIILFVSSIIFLSIFLSFFYLNEISFQSFINQYINYPREIGASRYLEYNFTFKNIFLDFKFIHLIYILLLILNINKLFQNKNFYKTINFKLFLISSLLFFSLALHQILTKNQIYIFFLIPLFSAFFHIEIMNQKIKYKKHIIILLISFCIFVTLKYNQRFNIERKFHELNNVDFNNSIDAELIDTKFKGLKWITPEKKTKKKLQEEIETIKKIKKILKQDDRKKMLISNYSIFSVLLDESTNSPTRWYPGDSTGFPKTSDKSFKIYKNFLIKHIKKKKIEVAYVISDVREDNLVNYLSPECLEKTIISKDLTSYLINKNCDDFDGK